jgi:hypothetical protein
VFIVDPFIFADVLCVDEGGQGLGVTKSERSRWMRKTMPDVVLRSPQHSSIYLQCVVISLVLCTFGCVVLFRLKSTKHNSDQFRKT